MKRENKNGGKLMNKKFYVLGIIFVMALSFVICNVNAESDNIVKNGSFEELTGQMPTGWYPEIFDNTKDVTKITTENSGRNNSKCISITNNKLNDSKVFQDLKVEPNKVYKFSCWIKAENIKNPAGSANITVFNGKGIFTSVEYSDTKNDWKEMVFHLRMTDASDLKVGLRLGGNGTTNEGKAYFDDLTVQLVENPPAGTEIIDFYIPKESTSNVPAEDKKSGGSSKVILIVIGVIVVVGGLIFVEIKFSKNSKNKDLTDDSSTIKEDSDEEYVDYDEDDK